MDIPNPRRILAVGASDSGVVQLLKDLTGSAPKQVDDSVAGLSHNLRLETSYYTADIPIWIDDISNTQDWRTEFMKPEAGEVVNVVGAWIYCFRKPIREEDTEGIKASIQAIQEVVEKACGYGWDGISMAVAMPQSITPHLEKSAEDWEDLCRDFGFEYVDAEAKGKNEFGESMGVARIKEALEANDWAADDLDADASEGLDDEEAFADTFAAEGAEMGREFMGLKTAINGGDSATDSLAEDDEALQVEEMERMMSRLHFIKDKGAEMSQAERRRFAAKAVSDLMKNAP